jgi:hypothetical protein
VRFGETDPYFDLASEFADQFGAAFVESKLAVALFQRAN